MAIIKFITTIRNHWKKSLFAAGAVSWGVSYAQQKYKINRMMRTFCEEAATYGDGPIDAVITPKRFLVILNPAANKKSAEKEYEKYCEPILNLGGVLVDVIRTDSEGHARRYVEELESLPDAILVAGGDGTISETVTGLLRRSSNRRCPIGILPLGRTNSVATKISSFPVNGNGVEEVKQLAEFSIAVLRGKTVKKNVMKVQPLNDAALSEGDVDTPKPIYALGSLHWGAFRDAESFRDKYWYVGPLREYVSSLFNAFGNALTWECRAKVSFTPPCQGCSNCFVKIEENPIATRRWWQRLIPSFNRSQANKSEFTEIDYSKVVNSDCLKQSSMTINPSEVILFPDECENIAQLTLETKEPIESSYDFIKESWKRIRTKELSTKRTLAGRTLELIPETISTDKDEAFYSIDSESFEVRPVRISVVPKAIDIYVV